MKEFPCLVRYAQVEIFTEGQLKAETIRKVAVKEGKRLPAEPRKVKQMLYTHFHEEMRKGYERLGLRRSEREIAQELGITPTHLARLKE